VWNFRGSCKEHMTVTFLYNCIQVYTKPSHSHLGRLLVILAKYSGRGMLPLLNAYVLSTSLDWRNKKCKHCSSLNQDRTVPLFAVDIL
jgi:hypothetical protein